MKKVLLAFSFFFLTTLATKANDTLTRAQVYNFNVGDTFDYKDSSAYDNGPASQSGISYLRYVIDRIYYSSNNDTLTIVRRREYPLPVSYDSLIVSDLTKYEVFNYSQMIHNFLCDSMIIIDSSSQYYNGRIANAIYMNCFEQYYNYTFREGLGVVTLVTGGGSPEDGFSQSVVSLIYYSKGAERWGTPILNGGNLLHYTPIPEECAVWTNNIYSYVYSPPLPNDSVLAIQEQIRSGNRLPYHGHTYVEMIYRSSDLRSNIFTPDSLLGYYRNDTTNKLALFYHSLSDSSFFQYDFSTICPSPNCMSQILVSGQLRTVWPGYIEGIGSTDGLIKVKYIAYPWPPVGQAFSYYYGPSNLSCFSICGQTIYPNDSSASCPLLSGISQISNPQPSFSLFPNPASTSVTISIDEGMVGGTATISDVTGRELIKSAVQIRNPQFDIRNLSSGVYFVTVTNKEGRSTTKKLVVSK